MTTVGVVVPCFNAGRFLAETIDSIRAQSYPEISLVICDDGSTDPVTRRLLDEYEEQGETVVRQANAGPGAARNAGIRLLETDYVLSVDADDRLLPGAIETYVAPLDARPEVGIVACAFHLIGDDSGLVRCAYAGIESMLASTTIPSISMFRREDWERAGGYPEEIRRGEDWGFWMRLLRLGCEVAVIDEPLYEYRISPQQTTRNPDLVEIARAHSFIHRDNREIYAQHPDFLIEELARQQETFAQFRQRYLPLQRRLRRIKQLIPAQLR